MRFQGTILVLFFATILFSQSKPYLPYVAADAPSYMHLLNKEVDKININEVIAAYNVYYDNHAFEKNSYTQYYKKFLRWSRPYVSTNGKIILPDADVLAEFDRNVMFLRNSDERMSNWTFAGPNKTYDTNGATKVTWQTNVYSIDISESDANVLLAGGESGGMWKTTDKGLNWILLSKNITHGAFGAVKIDPLNNQVFYAGTGGKIIKSIDQGLTWSTVYSETDLWVNEFAISSSNTNVILAASEKGLLRSTDGGANWTKINNGIEYWTIKRKEGSGTTFYAIKDNGTTSDFVKSTDSGASWTAYNAGWWSPSSGEAMTGGIIATCPSNPVKLYAYLIGSGSNLYGYAGVYVSNDDGVTWSNTNPTNALGNSPTAYSIPSHTNLMANNGVLGFNQGFYDMAIVVNPNNENQIIAGGTSWFKSNDGGATWNSLGGYVGNLGWSHPDIQWCAAKGNDLWIASDGGINYSTDFANSHIARMDGISGSDMWGFDSGWNEDILVGGRYHNGNMGYHQSFPQGNVYRLGGAESATGYVNPGPDKKVYHSDIGGKIIKPGFGNGVTNFPVALWPNESYAYYANSEMVFHPYYYNTIFLGKDNHIYKSTDGGSNFEILYTFPGNADNEVYEIEIARSNPNIMYCSQWDGTDDAMYKSINGGLSWTPLTSLPLPNNNDRVKMAVSSDDAEVLWVAVTYGSNGKKIYKSTNGGTTWINLTTSILNGIRITNIMAQYGTNGGIYLGTNAGVFYRNNTHSEWQAFSTGLPLSAETNRLKPFYRDGKIRNGCWGFGIWESPLFENSSVEAMPMVSAKEHGCVRDTVYFDDYSVVNHTGASWQWNFPGASYVSNINSRNPKVLYNNSGTYNVTLSVSNGGDSDTRTVMNMITVLDGCALDTVPGKAMYAYGSNKHAANTNLVLQQTDSLTITAWVKPIGIQPDYSAIWMNETGDAGGFNFKNGNNSLAYHWPGGQWWWDSGLIVNADQWNFVAMVVKPTGVTLYCNNNSASHNISLSPLNIDGFRMGNYKGWDSRNMTGYIDEVALYNRVLSSGEIRDLRHLIKSPAQDASLVAYYQFNEDGNICYDKAHSYHATLFNGANKQRSRIPVGKGVSDRINVTSGGLKNFSDAGVKMYFPTSGTYPNGEIVVSRLNQLPDTMVTTNANPNGYWVINNYGSNQTFSTLDSIRFQNSGIANSGCNPVTHKLNQRNENAELMTWLEKDQADVVVKPDLIFSTNNGVNTFGQFVLSRINVSNKELELCNQEDDDCDGLIDEDAILKVMNTNNSGPLSFRAMLECAGNGDTINFDMNLDTIQITQNIEIGKSILISGNTNTRIKFNLSHVGFTGETEGIYLTQNGNVILQNLTLIQKDNSESIPFIRNIGQLELNNVNIKGNVVSKIKNQPPGILKSSGSNDIR